MKQNYTSSLKRTFSAVLLLLVSTVSWAYDFEVYGIYYNINEDMESVEVTYRDFSDCGYYDNIAIPSSVDYNGRSYCVTRIGGSAFYGCASLTFIDIPSSVTSIGGCAFRYCSSLPSIDIPAGVTSIENAAFEGCTSLTSIDIPSSVTRIEWSAFRYCHSLTSMRVSKSNSVYDSREGCNAIIETSTNTLLAGCKNTVIPSSVTSIGDYAFEGCYSLTSISIPDGVTSIGDYTFSGCHSLTSISIPDGVTNIGNCAFRYCHSLTSISIPDGVTSIGDCAFSGCNSLTSISIPDGVTSIGDHTFSGCNSLTSISIPAGVTSIGNYAFTGCNSLTSMRVSKSNSVYDSREGCNAIIETSTNTLLAGCKNTVIPSSVTGIGGYAFSGCNSLTSISIPDGVTSIGDCAFFGCNSLTSISIPDGVTSIGDHTFSGCNSLTSIVIPDGVTSIGDYAFSDCNSLAFIDIPSSVTSIRDCAFQYCSSLTSVICRAEKVPKMYFNVFYNVTLSDATLYVPSSAIGVYKLKYPWCNFGTILPLEDYETSIDTPTQDNSPLTAPYYTPSGQRVNAPAHSGIYIHKGRKVIVR